MHSGLTILFNFFLRTFTTRKAKEAEGVIFMLTDILVYKRNFNNFNVVRDEEQSHLPQHVDQNIFWSEDLFCQHVDKWRNVFKNYVL